jgi:DNA-binding PadR family transcriptional regulator
MWPFRFAMHKRRGLRNMVVYLLSSSPKNGVELMDGVEAITRGWWRPTAGSIYPLLEKMAEEGTIRKKPDDGRYELTARAKNEANVTFGPSFRKPHSVDDMLSEMNSFVSNMEDLKSTRRENLEPHGDKMKSLARRLLDLVRDETDEKN